jgi:iron(III) transport system substrate-binding protein
MPKVLLAVAATMVAVATLCTGCSTGDELIIYSGRNENLIRPLLEEFARDTGIDVRVVYNETSALLPILMEEGDRTPADVFFSQDAGALGTLAIEDMLATLPEELLELVDERFRDPEGRWLGITGRARVMAYNTDRLDEGDLPATVLDLVEPKWRGRVGFPPTNASFVAFVSALREQFGDARTRQFLEGLAGNGAKEYDNNILTIEAVAAGEIDIGLVNHYYLYNAFRERGSLPVANHYAGSQEAEGDATFVNVAGVGIIKGSDQVRAARRFVGYLLDEKAQRYFRDETAEYPLRRGVDAIPELPRLSELRTIDVPLTELGRDLEGTVEMLKEVGIT